MFCQRYKRGRPSDRASPSSARDRLHVLPERVKFFEEVRQDGDQADAPEGFFGRLRLRFAISAQAPILLGRDFHFGGGLFHLGR